MALMIAGAAENPPLPLVSPMFGDNMVLQRGKPVRFWGWAQPGESIRVELDGRMAKAVTGSDGRWQAELKPPPPGGPYTVTFVDGRQSLVLHEVLVGDVWLCGGQSNMELPLSRTRNGAAEIQSANHPEIRLFTVKQQSAYTPAPVVQGSWKICSPGTITEDGGFSAVGYYFGRKLQAELHVPIGLIQDCVGGTPAEAWTRSGTLRTLKDFDAQLGEVERLRARGGKIYGNFVMPWYDEFDIGQSNNWFAPDLDDHDWKTVTLPGGFDELGVAAVPSVCYFRKTINVPDPLPPGRATIHLGVIEKMDTVQVNGRWIGASAWVENPRSYDIPDGGLKAGSNQITLRVLKTKADGGFRSKAADLKLELGDKSEIPLGGEWQGRLSVDARPPHPLPLGYENWPVMPCVLYNGMLAPLAPLAITGAIWYQGEANVGRAGQYRRLLPAMISDWRKAFQQGDFPFYIVSLAAFLPHQDLPGDDAWADLRESQAVVARTVPHSALAVTIDVGDAGNIHPRDKREVGERLAFCALANQYGRNVAFAGPTFASLDHLPGALKLHFKNAAGGLVVKGDQPGEFSVAGKDRKWFWADAKVEGDCVMVSSRMVPEPVSARYAWQANPAATLFNSAGLPAVPFRTDNWHGVTEKHQP